MLESERARAEDNAINAGITMCARFLAVIGCVWFAVAVSWGLFAPPASGHFAAAAAGGIISENIVRFHTWGGAWSYSVAPPPASQYYGHHPFGQYWVGAVVSWLLGHQDCVLRLHPLAMSALTPVLLYKLAKHAWGEVAGAATVAGFVMLPIELGFGAHFSQEAPVIFGCALFFYCQLRIAQTGRSRFLWLGTAGVFFATCDWPGYVVLALVLGYSFLSTFVLPRSPMEAAGGWPSARFWAVSVSFAVSSLALCILLFYKAGQIEEWLDMAARRAGGGPPSLAHPLAALETAMNARGNWMNEMFTPVALRIGRFALPVLTLRLLVTRADSDVFGLAVFLAAAVHYLVFREGADVHIYWPQYFALYYALALGGIAATVEELTRHAASRLRSSTVQIHGKAVALLVTVLPPLLTAPDAVRLAKLGRISGGRYDNHGDEIRADDDKLFVLKEVVAPHLRWGDVLDVSTVSFGSLGWDGAWAAHARSFDATDPEAERGDASAHPFWIGRASELGADAVRRIAKRWHVRAYGDIWVVDQREPYAPLEAFSLGEHSPGFIENYLFTGGLLGRSVPEAPDPFLTWEWRLHVGEPSNEMPTATPRTLEQMRVAHNMAVARQDVERAAAFERSIRSALDTTGSRESPTGMKLLGVRTDTTTFPLIDAWFEAVAPENKDTVLTVRGDIERALPWSLIPVDRTTRRIRSAPWIPTGLARAGFLYTVRVETMHRLGVERFRAAWGDPSATDLEPTPASFFDLDVLPTGDRNANGKEGLR